ncbi:MAG: NAD(P)-dependent oxidoreductase [Chthoniobacterales bacterium]|nr:NAD(P)-dependent oxidoreductase [Chthoniobacterales bacterium]
MKTNFNLATKRLPRLLITGSTGFVGRNLLLHVLHDPTWSDIILPVRSKEKLCEQLRREGIENLPEHLHLCSAKDERWLLEEAPPADVAIHCAGLTFSRKRTLYFKTNVEGSIALAKALPKECRLLVLSSQSAAGPTPAGAPARTRHHTSQPRSWYGESKLAMEKELFDLNRPELLILRPPMIIGPRDQAIFPLFQMARGRLRIKPGLRPKEYSWIDIGDLCRALLIVAKSNWSLLPHHDYFITSNHSLTDLALIQTAVSLFQTRGITLPLPHAIIRLISLVADQIPPLHQPLQSLGRDRVKEIIPQRWIVDGSDFERDFPWKPQITLEDSLRQAAEWYVTSNFQAK